MDYLRVLNPLAEWFEELEEEALNDRIVKCDDPYNRKILIDPFDVFNCNSGPPEPSVPSSLCRDIIPRTCISKSV